MKSLKKFAWVLALGSLLTACDLIDADDRIKVGPSGCTVAEPAFTPRPAPQRKVLVEDYTGHRCGNCPRAAEILHALETQYGERIVGVAMHSDNPQGFTYPTSGPKYVYDFRSAIATEWDNKFGKPTISTGLPCGSVNRKTVNGTKFLPINTWTSQAGQLLAVASDMDLQIKPFYDNIDQKLCAFVYTQVLNTLPGNYNLVVYLMEDHITNWQKDYQVNDPLNGDNIPDYDHSHILRKELTTIFGKTIFSDNAEGGKSIVEGFSIDFNQEKWNVDNCYIVAYIYNQATDEVIQAEKQKVIP